MRRRDKITGPERKRIFKEAFSANTHITIASLANMTGDSTSTIENALYESQRYPSMWHLYVIERAIRKTGGTLSRELARSINRYKNRINRFCIVNMQNKKPKLSGDKIASYYRKYKYNDEMLTTGEIAKLSHIDLPSLSSFCTRNCNEGDDVTAAVEHKIKSGRFSKKHI
jgi:hypothetical protein